MSGHSKWANIKRKKEANDKLKSNVFSKLSRQITVAVLEGGGITDPENNVKLRLAIEKAHSFNMPKENIKRAIDRAIGPNKSEIKEMIYEGFAPNGVCLMILAHTDNQNRTLSEIRNILEKHGGKLGNNGSVSYLFLKCGLITINKSSITQEKILDFAEALEIIDIDEDENNFYIYISYSKLGHVKDILKDYQYTADIDFKPQSPIVIDDDKKLESLSLLIEDLEALDDVQKVFTNL